MATHSSILARKISNGQRRLTAYSPRGCKESDMTEHMHARTHTHTHAHLLSFERLIQKLVSHGSSESL